MPGSDPIPFTDLSPVASTKGAGLTERFDPYWSGVWPSSDGGASVSWVSRRSSIRLNNQGLGHPRKGVHPYDADQALATLPHRQKWLYALGAINLWQTLTAQQLAAITGYPTIAHPRSVTIASLWTAELIQRGGFHAWGQVLHGAPELYRPDPKIHTVDLSHLDYQDWLGVTTGALFSRSGSYDRHNVLTTELSIRVGELCPTIPVVLGEALADWKRHFDPATNPSQSKSADAVWIREDGLRILVETTVNDNTAGMTKIKQSIELLSQDRSGSVVILFLTCNRPDAGTNWNRRLSIKKDITAVVSSLHGSVRSKAAGHIAVADWGDWFPAPGLASPEFLSLTAMTPTGPTGERWQPVDLADPTSIPITAAKGAPTIDMPAVLANVARLYGIPHWMRPPGDPAPLEHHLLAAAGIPDDLLFDPVTGDAVYKPPPIFSRPHRGAWSDAKQTHRPSPRVSSGRRVGVSPTSSRSSAAEQR